MRDGFRTSLLATLAAVAFSFFIASCQSGPKVINDLSDDSFTLVNQDSAEVQFPSDFEGDMLVVGFIYTHCPDICPVITAKLSNLNKELGQTSDIHFVEITFDPVRDTPSVLKRYMNDFRLDSTKFTMLTGDSSTVDSVLGRMDIMAKVVNRQTDEEGNTTYLMNHTNRILVMDPEGRVRFEYPGSAVPVKNIIEDINKLR